MARITSGSVVRGSPSGCRTACRPHRAGSRWEPAGLRAVHCRASAGLTGRRRLPYSRQSLFLGRFRLPTAPASFRYTGPAALVSGFSMTAEPRPAVVLGPAPPRVACAVRASRTTRSIGVLREQAHLPAEQPPTGEDPRFPSADADARWSRHPCRTPQQGSLRAVRLRPSTCCRHVIVCARRQTSRRRCVALGAAERADVSSSSMPTGPTRERTNRRGSVLSCPRPWAGPWPARVRSASCVTSWLSG